jgi:hypothetical protein
VISPPTLPELQARALPFTLVASARGYALIAKP